MNFDNFARVPKAVSPLRSATAVQNGPGSWLRPFLVSRFGGLLERGQPLFPLGGMGGFAPGVVELHQPFEGFRDPARSVEIRGQAGLALLESFAALKEERFGFGIILLGQTDRAKVGDGLRVREGL